MIVLFMNTPPLTGPLLASHWPCSPWTFSVVGMVQHSDFEDRPRMKSATWG